MFSHTFKLIHRNIIEFKTAFLINLIGLSTGLTCALLIYLWISDEVSFDKFHENNDRLFQIMENQSGPNGITTQEATPIGMAYVLSETLPEIEYAATVTPMAWFPKFVIEHQGNRIKNEGKFVGKDFFRMFSFELVLGDAEHVFQDINSIVISEELAVKLFGSATDAAGKTISWMLSDIQKQSVVSGVFKKIPSNSSEQFDLLLHIELLGSIMNFNRDDLQAPGPSTFVMLKPGTHIEAFNRKVSDLMTARTGRLREYFATQYSNKYLYGEFKNGVQTGGRIEYVRLFSVIGLITLLIACINFMNLSTAKASKRIKNAGIRKAIGAGRKSLVMQYLAESLLISFLSLGIAIISVVVLLPYFNEITDKQLTMDFSWSTLIVLISMALMTGILGGSYPALYFSAFQPITALKGMIATSMSEVWTRKGLVVFQFFISTAFIVFVIVIFQQVSFVQNRNPGYDKDNVLYFELEGKVSENHHAFIDQVKTLPGVESASAMIGNVVGSFGGNPMEATYEGKKTGLHQLNVDYGLIETLGIPIKTGRSFSPSFNDDDRIVLNSAAVEALSIENPVGKKIDFGGRLFEIIGVTENFHYRSLHEEIRPLAFILEKDRLWNIFLRLKKGRERETIQKLQTLYAQFNPGFVLDYYFLDHTYKSQYASEKRVASISLWFAILAILISCLGLFGLAAFTAERRVKEISIRKVLGATPAAIFFLLSYDFIKLVFTAIVIALPVSYYITNEWLDNFAYQIKLEMWIFPGTGIVVVLVALITIGGHAVKSSRVNPAQSLKSE